MKVCRIVALVASLGSHTTAHAFSYLPDPIRTQVLAIDDVTGSVVGRIPTNLPSRAVALDDTRGRLYVANSGWLVADSEPSSISVWEVPVSQTLDPALQQSSVAGSFLNSLRHVGEIPTGRLPVDLVLDPSGTTLFVTNTGDETLSIVDALAAKPKTSVPIGGMPARIAYDPADNLLYVARPRLNDVAVLNAADGAVIDTIPVGTWPVDVAVGRDRTLIVANARDHTVSLVDLRSRTARSLVKLDVSPTDVVASPDGSLAYALSPSGQSVATLDVESGTVLSQLTLADIPNSLVVGPNEVKVLTFKRADLYIVSESGETILQHVPRAFLRANDSTRGGL